MGKSVSPSLFNRDSGILLHPSSLPGDFGVGDFGPSALCWLEALAESGQNLWQILPLHPTGYGDSPYQSISAFAVSSLFLSPESLYESGFITKVELDSFRMPDRAAIKYVDAHLNKLELARRASSRFFNLGANSSLRIAYEEFLIRQSVWLQPFALFSALKSKFGGVAWTKWPPVFRDRDPTALSDAEKELSGDIRRILFEQFILSQQWGIVRTKAQDLGIRIIGDMPIFMAHDSADVWCNPNLFRLATDGNPTVVAGVPPDYFSATGQLWGNPLYDWGSHVSQDFSWWRSRVRKLMDWVDLARIDHFRGFHSCWEIDGTADSAVKGRWVEAPGKEILDIFLDELGAPLPLIAEDLGVITHEVLALRDAYQLPGLRIQQFAFGSDVMKDTFIPEAYDSNCVAYTGTHDNDTVVGWFNSQPGVSSTRSADEVEKERTAAISYFGTDGSEINWDFINALYSSKAGATLVPLQDVLGLGSNARMNTPGTASGSWRWRITNDLILESSLIRLKELTYKTSRGLAANRIKTYE